MNYSIEVLLNLAAINVKLGSEFDPRVHMLAYYEELSTTLDNQPEPITIIIDILDVPFSIGNLLQTTKDLQEMEINPAQHPNSKQMIIISNNSLMKFSVDGFRKFGILKTVHIVETFEDAIAILNQQDRNTA